MLSIHILAYGIFAAFSGFLADRWRPRRVMQLGVVILGVSAASCSLAGRLWQFYLIFGIGAPLGLACCLLVWLGWWLR